MRSCGEHTLHDTFLLIIRSVHDCRLDRVDMSDWIVESVCGFLPNLRSMQRFATNGSERKRSLDSLQFRKTQ